MKKYPFYKTAYYDTFGQMLRSLSQKYGDKPAITSYALDAGSSVYSYAELYEDVLLAAAALQKRGLTKKHIAVVGNNSYEWLVAFFASEISGNIPVLIDIEQPNDTVESMLAFADTEFVFISADMKPIVDAGENTGSIPQVGLGCDSFRQFCAEAEYGEYKEVSPGGKIIVYTSGTTAEPKAVILGAQGIVRNAADSIAMVQGTKKVYTALPFYHVYGLTCGIIANLIAGAGIGINGDLKTMFRDFRMFDAGTMMAVPLIAEQLTRMLLQAAKSRPGVLEEHPKKTFFRSKKRVKPTPEALELKQEVCGSLELIICGGAPLLPHVAQVLMQFGIQVLQGYGITECSPLVSVNRNMDDKFDSVGMLLPGCKVRISGDGEVLISSNSLMAGYYKQEELTKEAVSDGWFHSGDIGMIDKQGYLSISGRLKNVIVMKNGKKVLPEEIEGYLKAIPLIKSAVVYGAETGIETDDVKIAASVFLDPQQSADLAPYEALAELQSYIDTLNKKLPFYKQIQIVNIREEEAGRTALGKEKRS
ncbi:MAG: AMP-binding protein [Christensenella sp.]|nr:AMP-binding protein [Christensenella sp.]